MVDDKPNLLAAMKSILKSRLTTIFVRQGHYALAADAIPRYRTDMTIERIGDLVNHNLSTSGTFMTITKALHDLGQSSVARQHHPRNSRQRHAAPLCR